jgi:hypothetical protein
MQAVFDPTFKTSYAFALMAWWMNGVSVVDVFQEAALEKLGFTVQSTGSSHCLFRAVSLQLFGTEEFHAELRDAACIHMVSVKGIRMRAHSCKVCTSRLQNRQRRYYFPIVADDSCVDFAAYLEAMRTAALGGDAELQVRLTSACSVCSTFFLLSSVHARCL